MPNLPFYAGPEVISPSLSIHEFALLQMFREHTESAANQNLRISNRPDVQSQHPGAGTHIQGPGGGIGPGQAPPPGQNMAPGHGGFQYK